MRRYRASYWRLGCDHMSPVMGHPMKTQREAVEQWNIERINDAVRSAFVACRENPAAYPCTPTGWPELAEQALASGSHQAVLAAGLALRSAHSQYGADFDRMPDLFVLRLALPHPLRDYPTASIIDHATAETHATNVPPESKS